MMNIETDSEEERAWGSSNIQSKYWNVITDFVDLFDLFRRCLPTHCKP